VGPNAASGQLPQQPVKKRAPTLYGIIVFKLAKGVIFIALAIAAYRLSDDDLPVVLQSVLHFFRIQPDTQFWASLAGKLSAMTETKMLWTAAGLFLYSLFGWVEGIGLIYRVSWAGWLAICESAFFIPLELLEIEHHYAVKHHVSWGIVVLMAVNIWIFFYLLANRKRLFRHHGESAPPSVQ